MVEENKPSGTFRIRRITAEQKDVIIEQAKAIGVSKSYYMRTELKKIIERFDHLSHESEAKIKNCDFEICGVPAPMLQKFKNIAKNLGTDGSTLLKIKIDEIVRNQKK